MTGFDSSINWEEIDKLQAPVLIMNHQQYMILHRLMLENHVRRYIKELRQMYWDDFE